MGNRGLYRLGAVLAALVLAAGASGAGAVTIKNPLQTDSFEGVIENILNFLSTIAIPLGVIFIVIAGIKYLTSRGNEEKVGEAKKALTYAVVGVAVILVGRGLIDVILDIIGRATEGGGTGS